MIAYFVMPCNGAEIFKAAKIGVCKSHTQFFA